MMRHLCDWCSCKAGLVLRGAGVNLSHPSPYSYKAFHNGVWINLSKVFFTRSMCPRVDSFKV